MRPLQCVLFRALNTSQQKQKLNILGSYHALVFRFCVSKPVNRKLCIPFPYNFNGYLKNQFFSKDNFKIKAILNQTFQHNLERGFFLAYDSLLDGIHDRDFAFLHSISQNKLGKAFESSLHKVDFELREDNTDHELYFTDLCLQVGEYHPEEENQSSINVELLDVINLKLYGNSEQKLEVDKYKYSRNQQSLNRVTLSLGCFIRSPRHLTDFNTKGSLENNYHKLKVVFETHSIRSPKSRLDLFRLLQLDRIEKLKYCHKYFLGKEYEWKIKALDNLC